MSDRGHRPGRTPAAPSPPTTRPAARSAPPAAATATPQRTRPADHHHRQVPDHRPMKYLARKRCTCPSQIAVIDTSHSACSGAPRPIWTEITLGMSSTPVKDGGRVANARRASATCGWCDKRWNTLLSTRYSVVIDGRRPRHRGRSVPVSHLAEPSRSSQAGPPG